MINLEYPDEHIPSGPEIRQARLTTKSGPYSIKPHVTQEEAAAIVHMTIASWQKLEQGTSVVKASTWALWTIKTARQRAEFKKIQDLEAGIKNTDRLPPQPPAFDGPPEPAQVRQSRLELGITQEQAARLVHIATRSWQKGEQGSQKIHPAVWELWCLRTHEFRE